MAFSFNVKLKDVEKAIAKAKSEIEANGGNFSGDSSSGKFFARKMGMEVKGNYSINGGAAKITIENKPFFVSDDIIEKEVGKFFA